MVAQVGALRVTVGADITGLQVGMQRAQRQVAQSAGAMKRSVGDLQLTFKEVATFSSRMFRTGALLFGGLVGARAILSVADASKNLAAALRLATSQYGSFAQANKDVQGIAERSRSDLLTTAQLYATLMRNADQFGASQAEVARITETVSKSFKISGATATEAEQATRQLVQAFQSGRLQGDEFRSIMENAPRLSRLLADSLGKTVGELRNMSKEGKLTADVLARAFSDQKFTATIDEEFRQLPVTFDQAMGQLYNAAVITFGEFDSGGQFSTALANFITGGTEGFASLGDAAYNFGAQTRGLLDSLDAFRASIASLKTEGISGFLGLNDAAITLDSTLRVMIGTAQGVMNALANLFNAPANIGRLVAGQKAILDPVDLLGPYNKAKTDAVRRRVMGRSARDMLAEFGFSAKPPAFHAPAAGGGGGGGRKGPSAESLAKRAQREMEERLRRDAQYDSERRRNQIELLQADKDNITDAAAKFAISRQITDLEHEEEVARIELAVKLGDRTRAEADALESQLADLNQLKQIAINHEEEAQQRKDAAQLVDATYDIQQQQLQAESQLATTAEDSRDIQLRILDLQERQEKARLEAVIADEESSEAAKEEARRRLAALGSLFAAQRQGVINSTRNPLEQWAASVPKTAAQITEALQGIEANALDGIADAISGIIDGTKSMADAFGDMARSIISDIIQMTVKMLIFQAISGLFKGSSFTGGGATAASGTIDIGTYGGPRASGGPVVPGRTYMVGEKGPELVRFGAAGQVIPNHQIGGGPAHVIVELRDEMLNARIAHGAGQVVLRAAPMLRADAEKAIGERNRRAG